MPSHVKGTGCCLRHRRHAPRAVESKKAVILVKAQSRLSGKPDTKVPWRLPLKQRPNGSWSYRFGAPFRKMKQSSLSDHQRDPEDLLLERYT